MFILRNCFFAGVCVLAVVVYAQTMMAQQKSATAPKARSATGVPTRPPVNAQGSAPHPNAQGGAPHVAVHPNSGSGNIFYDPPPFKTGAPASHNGEISHVDTGERNKKPMVLGGGGAPPSGSPAQLQPPQAPPAQTLASPAPVPATQHP
jgi:hypothetical protein